ncbi:MAG: glycoside hydrolase family 3 C-terminal domain-containing protein [Bacteroidota bacterium]
MRIHHLLLGFTLLIISARMMGQSAKLPDYKNPDKGVEERVEELMTRMTLEDKVDLVGGNDFKSSSNIRLGIPEMVMTDGPLGPNAKGHSTNYSAMINLAATFNPDLMYSVAEQIGEETRIMGRNLLLGPNINIARVPHGGRTFEGFGEDPYLMSRMVVPYVKGVQSRNVITCTKHFVANNQEWNRFDVSAEMDERTLREIYLPAFKAAIQEGDTWSIMAAYNMFRGTYACENRYLLTDILKDDWGFSGIAISDWGGARSTLPMANSGLDLEMPTGKYYGEKLLKAIREGEVTEATLDDKVRRILRVMFKAGLFDESIDQYGGHSDQHHRRALALKVAQQSIILLKNENSFLPVDKSRIKSIAVIGPNGAEARMEGGGSGGLTGNYGISTLEGILQKVGDSIPVKFARGIPERSLDLPIAGPQYYMTNEGAPGIRAQFFNNKEQEGEPVHTRIDQDINFNWESASPVPGVVRPDKWSARWTGKLRSPGEGWYEIGLKADNGIRMYIDGKKILDAWIDGSPGKFKIARYKFEAGRDYDIQVDFYENIGTCRCKLGFAPYEPGDMMEKAVELAASSHLVVLTMGLDKEVEGEAVDRARLSLDEDQLQLIDRVLEVNRNVVVVLNNGTPVLMDGWIDRTPVIIEALYPGQEGGNALAEILFGDISPSGKLPLTFPEKWEDSPVYKSYPGEKEIAHYSEGIFVGYRYFDRENIEPLFPFGFGLSYTTFEYESLEISNKEMEQEDTLSVIVKLRNSGTMAGDEIVQLYIHDLKSSVEREVKSLKGFARVSLDPGESKSVTFKIDKSHLSFYDINSRSWIAEPGEFNVLIGSSSRDIRITQDFKLL